jgi:tetratricopeptide (TPR) repeat protein
MDFRFSVPSGVQGSLVQLSNDEAEQLLIQKLKEDTDDPIPALWQLAHFYKLTKQHEKALERLRQLMALLPDPEKKAACVLTMGQAMEQVEDYPAAVRYYKEALALEPTETFTWYFINNNLGFSLNASGQFADGEIYCRRAMDIDSTRPNAFKNLGMALVGQGKYHDAAEYYVRATQVNASDPRALGLLENLLKEHPELGYDFNDSWRSARRRSNSLNKNVSRCSRFRITAGKSTGFSFAFESARSGKT